MCQLFTGDFFGVASKQFILIGFNEINKIKKGKIYINYFKH